MTRTVAALLATLLVLPGAWAQEDAKSEKEQAKEEAKKRDDDAKAALKNYREARGKAKSADDVIEAVQKLENADPHPMIRQELANVLGGDRSIDVRIAAASALGKFKKDPAACEVLLQNAKTQKDEGLRRKCLQRFGAIAPFGKSRDLKPFFHDENNVIVKEAIESIEQVNSIRMLQPLIELLGELESIREDKGDQGGGGGAPLPGVPQGDNTNNQKVKRKRELMDPVRKAINSLWKKYDSRTKLNDYTSANSQLLRNKSFLMKIQELEDREDKGIKADPTGDSKDGKEMK
jgi:hypothetical protein